MELTDCEEWEVREAEKKVLSQNFNSEMASDMSND